MRLKDRPERHVVAERAGGALAGARAGDDRRVKPLELVIAQSQRGQRPWAPVIYHDIADQHEVAENAHALGRLEIDAEASLVAVHLVEEALAVPRMVAGVSVRIDARTE